MKEEAEKSDAARQKGMEMKVVVIHGSPRKGNTYTAAKIFMEAMGQRGNVSFTEFFLPEAVPEFCLGCQQCLSHPREMCPHARWIEPIYQAIMEADALLFTTPHYGASSMTGAMKNMLDHLAFFALTVSPRKEMFGKKAFVLTTATGSKAALRPMKKCLKSWGINRVSSAGIRMFTDKWEKMPERKRQKQEKKLGEAARRFYAMKRKKPYLSTRCQYFINRFVIRQYMGIGSYPFEYWKENGYFEKCPF